MLSQMKALAVMLQGLGALSMEWLLASRGRNQLNGNLTLERTCCVTLLYEVRCGCGVVSDTIANIRAFAKLTKQILSVGGMNDDI